jgi:hypothetical protein
LLFVLFLLPLLLGMGPVVQEWEPVTLDFFLRSLVTPSGASMAVGVVLMAVGEYLPLYQGVETKWKRLVFFLICQVVPIAATLLGVWWREWPFSGEAMFIAVQAGFVAFGTGTLGHGYLPVKKAPSDGMAAAPWIRGY